MNRCSTIFGVMTFAASLSVGTNLSRAQVSPTDQSAAQPAASTQTTISAEQSQSKMPAADSATFAKGTILVAEFAHGVNAGKLKPGDKVKAVLTQDLILKGKIVAATESKLVGHVTEVKRSTDADPESRLGVVFDRVLLKHHKELPVESGVQALLAPVVRRSRVDEPDQIMPPPMVASSGTGTTSGGRAGSNGAAAPVPQTATSSVALLNSIGAVPTVKNSPGGTRGNMVDLAQVSSAKLSASSGMRGVYGIKGITLSPPSSGPTLIISKKSNVKLENGTQLILVVLR